MENIILPAIRAKIGDWNFYNSTLTFKVINQLIKHPDEIHERQKLSDWIQREAIETHAQEISNYIRNNEQRFLGSLIIGVYDGDPQWSPLNVSFNHNHLNVTNEQKNSLEGKLGFLSLSGTEKLFAIDGQHRVSGIKKALENFTATDDIWSEEVGAIFVSHNATTAEGKERTRRLFTTVNKKAKKVSQSAIIALDEDNGFAIVTRRLIDSHWLFEDARSHISYTSSGAISPDSPTLITSIVGLYEIVKDLYSNNKNIFEKERPSEDELNTHFNLCNNFIDKLLEKSVYYKNVFVNKTHTANEYRNNLLFRPIGQRVIAKVVEFLISKHLTIDEALDKILMVNLSLNTQDWYYILWDPLNNKMINNKIIIAETKLLNLIREEARSKTNQIKLDKLLKDIGSL
ncbi:DNA sulfur modification protein DndB [Aliarcobacter butzleri]|uniref:DNA sulfur modification protein DndB n=1 Tax=Aliarcobacter butzleri TaxID=28197 RepID=UPI0026484DA6|nr:DNA sulfur modification protein DndB [Aliarcobacter butzleri]